MSWDYNRRQLQGLTTDVCGKYCCLLVFYMDGGYTLQQSISLFNACNHADRQEHRLLTAELGVQMSRGLCVQC